MENEWSVLSLEQLADIKTGKLDSNKATSFGAYPFFTCAPEPLRIDDFAFDCDAILLAGNNANGVFHLNRFFGKFNAYQRTYVITLKDSLVIDINFLFYTLRTLTARLGEYSQGTATKFLTIKILNSLPVPIPTIDEQRAVAHILGTLDDKIELLRNMNRTLEAMARAIFKSWFVDFDPVKAKAEGREPEAMDAATAALFPSEFEDSPIGSIPKGWILGNVSDLGDVICGKTPPTKVPEYYGEDVPFITIPDMHNQFFVTVTQRKLSTKGANFQRNKFLPQYSICVSCIATPGLVSLTTEPSQTNQQINSVVPNGRFPALFSFFVLRLVAKQIRGAGSGGSVFENLSKGRFENLAILLPPAQIAHGFADTVEPLLSKLLTNSQHASVLSSLRETLLPKLMSGQIRVREAEAMVEEEVVL